MTQQTVLIVHQTGVGYPVEGSQWSIPEGVERPHVVLLDQRQGGGRYVADFLNDDQMKLFTKAVAVMVPPVTEMPDQDVSQWLLRLIKQIKEDAS